MTPLYDVALAQLPFFMLASLRVAVTFAALPAPFGSVTPTSVRMAISMCVTVAICTALIGVVVPVALDTVSLLRAGLGELLVGAVMGMTVRVTLAAAEMAGSSAGESMGLGFATTVDPTRGDTVLPTTQLFAGVATLIFLALDGHHALIAALLASFRLAPVGDAFRTAAVGGLLQVSAAMMARGLQIAAPVVATMFIVQLGTAMASRAAPRVHLFAFSFAVVVSAGMVVLWFAAPAVVTAIGAQVRRLPETLSFVLGAS